MSVEIHLHDAITITHNCSAVASAATVRVTHSPCLGAAVGMIFMVFVYWLTGCLFVCAFACVLGMDSG